MKLSKRVMVFAKDRPGLSEALSYLKDRFTDVLVFQGIVGDKFPESARRADADICISYISPWIIPSDVLAETKEFCINFHPGPPEYPGIGCTNFAIYDGATEFGITAHHMDPTVDTGAIVSVRRFPIADNESVYTLTQKCYIEILEAFREVFDHYLQHGELPRSDETWQRRPYTRKELNELCRLTPDMDEDELRRRIRAITYPGMPGAFLELHGVRFVPERKVVNPTPGVFIIAEAGVNHNGSLDTAKKLVDAAKEAGADAVKFQSFRAELLVSPDAPKAQYQLESTDKGESQFEMLKRLELGPGAHEELMAYCAGKEILFLSTAFDPDGLKYLASLGLDILKIPSGEITNLPYLRVAGGLGKRIFLSTGMSDLSEVSAAIEALVEAGTPLEHITVLHCNTEYPSPVEDANLRAMLTMRDELGVHVGYSDHTMGVTAAVAAVTLGAEVVEKHLTLDRNMPGPDHKASSEPQEFAAMVRMIREVERALGDGMKRPMPSEMKNREIARKSIVAAQDIAAGEKFTDENLIAKRPATGMSPMLWDTIRGKVAKRDFKKDECIEL